MEVLALILKGVFIFFVIVVMLFVSFVVFLYLTLHKVEMMEQQERTDGMVEE